MGSQTQTSKIPSTHESERLKSVFLDAITHDFKTLLTSIKVSVTTLLGALKTDLEQRKELLIIIDEECDRINRLVSEASEIARLESGELKLNLASHTIGDLISAAFVDCRSVTSNREICLDVRHLDSRLLVDLSLAKRVLVARRLTFVANRLDLIAWLAWLVRNEEDRHKEKSDSEDTDEYWRTHR
jgi:two-component system, OmpR family, sensor histidine kinase KdpD